MSHETVMTQRISLSGEINVSLPSDPLVIKPEYLIKSEVATLEGIAEASARREVAETISQTGFIDAVATRAFIDCESTDDPSVRERIAESMLRAVEVQTPSLTEEERIERVRAVVAQFGTASHQRLQSADRARLVESRAEVAARNQRIDTIAAVRRDGMANILAAVGDNPEAREAINMLNFQLSRLDSTPVYGSREHEYDVSLDFLIPEVQATEVIASTPEKHFSIKTLGTRLLSHLKVRRPESIEA